MALINENLQGCTVNEGTEYRQNFHREFDSVSEISDLTWFVIKYEGENDPPKWLDDVTTPGTFSLKCTWSVLTEIMFL